MKHADLNDKVHRVSVALCAETRDEVLVRMKSANVQVSLGNCAPEWQQCGGKTWTGANCCEAGLKCNVVNEWYHQCVKDPNAGGNSGCTVADWGQCGGKSWSGGTCCKSLKYECVPQPGNEWYSQCKPCSGSCCSTTQVRKNGVCQAHPQQSGGSSSSSSPPPPPPPSPPSSSSTPTGPPPTYVSTNQPSHPLSAPALN